MFNNLYVFVFIHLDAPERPKYLKFYYIHFTLQASI